MNDSNKQKDGQTIINRENPHKYLLYKPSFSQFYTYIAAAFKDLSPHGVMLVYLSADNCEPHFKSSSECLYFSKFLSLFGLYIFSKR